MDFKKQAESKKSKNLNEFECNSPLQNRIDWFEFDLIWFGSFRDSFLVGKLHCTVKL